MGIAEDRRKLARSKRTSVGYKQMEQLQVIPMFHTGT
jgi:hypothetical protein